MGENFNFARFNAKVLKDAMSEFNISTANLKGVNVERALALPVEYAFVGSIGFASVVGIVCLRVAVGLAQLEIVDGRPAFQIRTVAGQNVCIVPAAKQS